MRAELNSGGGHNDLVTYGDVQSNDNYDDDDDDDDDNPGK